MAASQIRMVPGTAAGIDAARLDTVVLARLACTDAGLSEAALGRDVAPLVSHRLSPAEWRLQLAQALARLAARSHITHASTHTRPTQTGMAALIDLLPTKAMHAKSWEATRDGTLVALALDMKQASAARLRLLATPDGLRGLVLERAFKISLVASPTPARLRAGLAVAALERAFGHQIKSRLGRGSGLSAKAGRLLAGQLAAKPRDFGTDNRLVAALAAEQAGAPQMDEAALRLALLRHYLAPPVHHAATAGRGQTAASAASRAEAPTPAEARPPFAAPAARLPQQRPDLVGFAAEVQAAARARAEGWPGARKAYISHVYEQLTARRPEWRLSPIEFKGMLAEAHRAGCIVLANVDLKDKGAMQALQDSALTYKNTVWHQVRVQD